ncbi:RPA-related protein RADX [Araneus ventricosus]|uniref:RPA-related protein RADX n=1 Tax=Araneus ventricosus TaxID=182803 RepID=A0A4Y2HMS6_ARAVE|nr:RPA-related protein RADX [Araneus ventricosus]
MAGSLKNFRSILREYKLISDSSRIPGEFQIIAIYCYSADSNFLKALTPPFEEGAKEVIYLYDIVLTDGTEKLKCFLALPLGHLVQKNIIKIGSYVQIQKAKLCYLEGEYNDSHIVQYVFLEAIKILEYSVVAFPDLAQLRFITSTNYRETQLVPLVTGRKCYTYPWVPVYPHGEEWINDGPLEFSDADNSPQNIFILQNVADDWMRMPKPYPTIFVRVLARGMLYYYGFNKNDKSHPFMAKLVIGDSSSASLCVLFGKGAMSLYYHALPGTILLIEGYSISKLQSPLFPRLRGAAGNLPFIDLEIVIGDFTSVRIVPPDNNSLLMQIALLPIIEFSFANQSAIDLAADESTVDVIGLITHVTLFHRFMYKFGKFHARCYLELIDGSSHLPFVVIIYNNVLRFPVEDLHPGQVLVGTHMKVCHLQDSMLSDHQIRTYLKSTHYTELFTSHGPSNLYVRYPAVTAVASFIRDQQQEIDFIRSNVLRAGGIPTFFRGYRSLEAYKESFGHSFAGKMIPGAYWRLALDSLIHRERRCVTLGGFIVQVEYFDIQTVNSPQPVYGWSYGSNVVSRRTLFVNIKARYKLGNITPLNTRLDEKLMFPSQYASEHEERFKAYRKFPSVDATDWCPPSDDEIESFPVLSDGYYIVTIASLHYQAVLQCIYIPEPSSKPHPTFIETLNGNFEALPLRNAGSYIYEPPRYTWDEVKEVNRTASEVCDKTFVFAVELHRPKTDVIQAHLKRAYVCPPDQIGEAMAADRVQ